MWRRIPKYGIYIFLLCIALFAVAVSYAAEGRKTLPRKAQKDASGRESPVTIRVGKYSDHLRIVFETSDSLVQKASVFMARDNTVKVEFQSPVAFRVPLKSPQKGFSKIDRESLKGHPPFALAEGLRISVNEDSCTLYVDNLDDINVSKLASPPRIVVDAFAVKAPADASPEKTGTGARKESPLQAPDISEVQLDSFVIDAGHGGSDSGIRYANKSEKDITLLVAKELAAVLGKKGKKVFLTRKGDQTLSLSERMKTAARKAPGMFLSIHTTSGNEFHIYRMQKAVSRADKADNGAEQGKQVSGRAGESGPSSGFEEAIAKSLRSEFNLNVKQEKISLATAAGIDAPALLIELPSPEKFSYDGKTRGRLVTAIMRGIAYASMRREQGEGRQGPLHEG